MSVPALFVERWGTGPPVAFLHGLGASARYWERLRQATSGYEAVAPDLLGFGRSPAPADSLYDVDAHLDALAPVVRAGSLVVAHSTGGLLGVALACRRPDLVSALLLLGLPVFPDEATARVEIGRLGLLARLTVEASPWARRLCTAMCRLRPLAIALAPRVIADLPPSIARDGLLHAWTSYHRTLERVVLEYRLLPDVVGVPAAVTLLHGHADRTAPSAYVERLVEDADARGKTIFLQVIQGDHHLALRHPETVGAAMRRALA